jgi:hypothetical protein
MAYNEYLRNILNKYSVNEIKSHIPDQVYKLLGEVVGWGKQYCANPEILPSGSMAKGTAINFSSDYDYLLSLETNETKNDIFDSLYRFLIHCYGYSNIRRQNVSLRVSLKMNNLFPKNIDVDITPANSIGYNDYTIYISKRDTWQKTNIQQHINDISKSGRLNEIKLAKIWREERKLDFPSIYLEYLVIDNILKYKSKSDYELSNNFKHILDELANSNCYSKTGALFARIEDPSRTGNILSDLLTPDEKRVIIQEASSSIGQYYSNLINVVW